MTQEDFNQTYILQNNVNSFAFLYHDATKLLELAKDPKLTAPDKSVILCRTALLLYIISLEGLINYALAYFSPENLRKFILDREEKLGIREKWELLPMMLKNETFDFSKYPWSHFSELITIRNDYVHPKHNRKAYYKAEKSKKWKALLINEIPRDSNIKEKDVVYRQTRIPKAVTAIQTEHVETVKTVVDDMIEELNKLLDGRIKKEGWFKTEHLKLIYPDGAKLDDLRQLDEQGLP